MTRSHQAHAAVLAVALALGAASAHAQGLNPGPPGPFVIDIRGATSSVPSAGEFYPPPDDNDDDEGEVVDITVPARGFGFEVGAHVYPFQLGPARIGLGASYTHVRATVVSGLPVDDPPGSGQGGGGGSGTGGGSADDAAPVDVILTARSIAPQVSFNFGSANGWSYLSAGYGRAAVRTTLGAGLERSTDGLSVINFGGGARWFFSDHFGIGFDVRWHRAGSTDTTPGTTMFAAAVGLSVK